MEGSVVQGRRAILHASTEQISCYPHLRLTIECFVADPIRHTLCPFLVS